MLKLRKIAITGGVSCGKSQVADFLRSCGAYVVDADQIVHHLLTPETPLGQQVIELLGSNILVDGKIDRSRVANKVFLNPKLLNSLENLLHPPVYEQIEAHFQKIKKSPNPPSLFVAEVPLLFESGGNKYFDKTIAVISSPETCWQRYRNQTGHEREDFNRRMARQMTPDEKAERADFVIRNDGTIDELRQQTETIFHTLTTIPK